MTQKDPQNFNPLNTFNGNHLLKQGVGLISSLSILSSGFVVAQTEPSANSFVVPVTPLAPPPALKRISPTPQLPARRTPRAAVRRQSIPTPNKTKKRVRLSAPRVSIPPTSKRNKPSRAARNLPAQRPMVTQPSPQMSKSRNNNGYIDTTNYNPGVRRSYQKPDSVVLKERSTGCKTVLKNGQLASGSCRVTKAQQRVTKAKQRPVAYSGRRRRRISRKNLRVRSIRPQALLNPSGVTSYAPPIKPKPIYNRATRFTKVSENSKTALMFPLSIPASITSAFGFRFHPITGSRRLHAGTDIGAPIGTPVLAAYSGKVEVASSLSGYGLTVILRHEEGTQESRYAHLSQILVEPGEWVEQGTVIGLVGNTGFSTGPHLHFEWRHRTKSGWVPVDAGLHLEYAMGDLIRSIPMPETMPIARLMQMSEETSSTEG
ncbi:MAG: peptidoglycan DD-metalloendopeptidase family protein [Moorea sp. SIO2B7]|nr:peptidoglycan DD-metalloendopeptidase family protein [Moorena sp. SIO2B7]